MAGWLDAELSTDIPPSLSSPRFCVLTVIQRPFELLHPRDLPDGLEQVLLDDVVALDADGEHAGLRAHVAQVSAVEPVGQLHHGLVVDVAVLGDAAGVNLENLESRRLVWQRDLDLSVESSGPQQRRVERVGSVGCHHHLHLSEVVEPVKLVEQLHQRALDLAIGGRALAEAATADGVDLVLTG